MQAESIESIISATTIEAPDTTSPTAQDGFPPTKPSSLEGDPQLYSNDTPASPDPADSNPAANRVAPSQLETSHQLRGHEGGFILPGERISAYENASTPSIQQPMGFQVIKRSDPSSYGLSLTDCPNGACATLLVVISPQLTLF